MSNSNNIRKVIRKIIFENSILKENSNNNIFKRELSNDRTVTYKILPLDDGDDSDYIHGRLKFSPPYDFIDASIADPEDSWIDADIHGEDELEYVQIFDGYEYYDIEKDFSDVSWELNDFFESIFKKVKNIYENIDIPINVGDEILGGKFKNKKITVKDIGKNEKGDITINGKPLLRFRIPNKKS